VKRAGNPEYWQMTPAQARESHNRKAGLLEIRRRWVFKVEDRRIPGPAVEIPVRIYTPRYPGGAFPVLVWLHGGGHVVGTLDTYDAICRTFALQADCIVVSVDYRLAPEYAERLKREGNLVELAQYAGMIHPFFSMGGAIEAGRRAHTHAAQALKRAFGAAANESRVG
jgi:acetyl esterase/lipase